MAPDAVALDELSAAIEGARRGDSESFRILYAETQPRLLRYLGFLAGGEAEDIASETWLQAVRDLHTFAGDYDNFRGWITTIARHRAMDHARQASRRPAVPVPVEDLAFLVGGEDTADRAIESISTGDALSLIATLPPDQAEAVLLRAVVGLDAKTAAQVTGKRPGAIRTAAYRGLKTLAKRLDSAAVALGERLLVREWRSGVQMSRSTPSATKLARSLGSRWHSRCLRSASPTGSAFSSASPAGS